MAAVPAGAALSGTLGNLAMANMVGGLIGGGIPLIAGLFGGGASTPSFNPVNIPDRSGLYGAITRNIMNPAAQNRLFQRSADVVSEQINRNLARRGMQNSSIGLSQLRTGLESLADRFSAQQMEQQLALADRIRAQDEFEARTALANAQGIFGADRFGFQTGANARSNMMGGLGQLGGQLGGLLAFKYLMGG